MPKKYTANCSKQVARQIKRNRTHNLPRLERLKECVGCMRCGKCDVPGRYLDGHHVDEKHKYQPLARLLNRRWLRLIREIFGIDRDKPGGGALSNSSASAITKSATNSEMMPRPAWNLKKKGSSSPGASTAAIRNVNHATTKNQMKQITIYKFSKAEVEELDFERFDRTFADWPNLRNGELANKLNSLAFIIEGYDGHPDELYHIPPVRRFYAELHRRWPWWLFFLNISNEGMAIPYFCLLGTIDAVKVDGSTDTGAIFNPVELLEIIRSDFPRMNLLFDHAGLSDNANDKRTHEIIQLFCSSVAEKGGGK